MTKNIKIKLFQTSKEFSSLELEWKEFEKSLNHQNLTSSFDWLYTWWNIFININNNTIGYDKKLLIICLYYNNKLISIAPFVKVYRRKFGIKISFIEFLGQQWSGIYSDIISDKKHTEKNLEIFNWLYKNVKFDIFFLKYIPEYSTNFKDDLFLYSFCPEVEIRGYSNYDEYTSNKYSKSLKQNIRTAFNKAKKSGIEIQTSVEELDKENFNETIQISKFKLLDGKNFLYKDKAKLQFMEEITRKMTSNVVFVKLNGKNVAYRTNVFFNNNKFCLDASYDRNFRKFELGSISVDANLKDSFIKNISIHSFGPGLDSYKRKFTKRNLNIYMYLKKGNTLKSYLLIKPMKKLTIRKENEAKHLLK